MHESHVESCRVLKSARKGFESAYKKLREFVENVRMLVLYSESACRVHKRAGFEILVRAWTVKTLSLILETGDCD
jgi:hypothetical protein